MIYRIITWIIILSGHFTVNGLQAQQYFITGADLCTDGTQSTSIGLSDSDPSKMYAIYRDGQLLSVRTVNSEQTPNPLDFGSFSETGKYTVVEFTGENPDYRHPEKGRSISGAVTINGMPVMEVPRKMEARSGETFSFQPLANPADCHFTWTARLESGKATGFVKTGAGMVTDKIVLTDGKPASLVYTITPFSPRHLGACRGNSRELIISILP